MSSSGHREKKTPTTTTRKQVPRSSSNSKNTRQEGHSSSNSPGEKQRKTPCARALYSFKAERDDELTFSKGVSIRLIRRVNAEWLEGELDGKIGIFPANYVTIEVGLPSGKGGSELANSGHPYARALHDFQGGEEADLPFRKGDLIRLISWGKGGWLIGTIEDKQGLFPASYVDVIEPLPSPKVERRNKSPREGGQSSSPIPKPRSRASSAGSSDMNKVSSQLSSCNENGPTSIPIPIPRSSTSSLSSAKSPDSPLLTRTMATSPPQGNRYMIQSGEGGINSDSGGSSPEEVTMGTVPVIQVEQPPPIPAKKKRHSVNSFDSVYMNEEGGMYAMKEPEPVRMLPSVAGSPPRRVSSATLDGRSKRHSMMSFPSGSSVTNIRGKTAAHSSGQPVPKPRTSAAKGAPNRLPPSPPATQSSSSIQEDVSGEENDQELFPGASSPSHPLQKVNERIAEVREMIASQEKLIQSACGLLHVTQDRSKREQLIGAIESRESTLQSLHQELSLLKDEKVRIQKSTRTVHLPVVPDPPRAPVDKKALKISHRKEVIDEIIRTEKEYCEEIDVCLKYIAPLLRKVEDVDCDVLLGNMEDVWETSKHMLAEMEEHREHLGRVFSTSSKTLLTVYTVYCKNHNVATVTLKRYMDDPVLCGKLTEIMQHVKGRTKSWDLGTLLIKPVQRILKYPLLLLQLKKETEEKHEDMPNIQKAEIDMKEVADAINEAKRRKELVEKYMDPSSKGMNIKSSMKHSVTKKMDRFITAMTQFAGLRNKTVDSKFEDERNKFVDLQEVLKSFQRGVLAWLKGVKDTFDCHQKLTVTLVEYCADRPPRQLAKYGEAVYSGLQLEVKSHTIYVENYILEPLKTTLGHFQEPAFIIHKRDQKLLDYDHVNHELDKAKESEKIALLKEDRKIAKRTYVAMNQQLLEDLPEFRARVHEMFTHLLSVFCRARLHFHKKCMEIWKRNVMDPQAVTSSIAIGDIHSQRLGIACQRSLLSLRCIGTSALTATLRSRRSIPTSETNWPASDTDVSPEPSDLEEGQVLEVLYDFEAQESSVELAVEEGDYVTLIAPHDQLGCGEWWLVQNAEGQGYVPALYLKVVPKDRIPEVLNDSFETVGDPEQHHEHDDSITLDSFLTCSDTSEVASRQSKIPSDHINAEEDDLDTQEIDRAVQQLDSTAIAVMCGSTS